MSAANDRFDSSVRALRELTAIPVDGQVTRSRVLGQLADGRRRRRNYEIAIVAAIFLLLIPAASVGWIQLKRSIWNSTSVPPHAGSPKRTVLAGRTEPRVDDPVALPERSVAENQPESPSTFAAAPAIAHPSTTPATQRASELDLYARAHELHFHGNDPRAALHLWTRYLDRFPHGRFVPEAQFNRAVCLVRIGDTEAARRLLTQLASSPGSDSPKDQAEKLLAELR
jgi:FimV-like protein